MIFPSFFRKSYSLHPVLPNPFHPPTHTCSAGPRPPPTLLSAGHLRRSRLDPDSLTVGSGFPEESSRTAADRHSGGVSSPFLPAPPPRPSKREKGKKGKEMTSDKNNKNNENSDARKEEEIRSPWYDKKNEEKNQGNKKKKKGAKKSKPLGTVALAAEGLVSAVQPLLSNEPLSESSTDGMERGESERKSQDPFEGIGEPLEKLSQMAAKVYEEGISKVAHGQGNLEDR